jgi:hypothetical protein
MEEAFVTVSARPRAQIIQASVIMTGLIPALEISKPLKIPIQVETRTQKNIARPMFPVTLNTKPAIQPDKTTILPEDRSIFPEIITKVIPTATIVKEAFCCIRLKRFPIDRKE